MPHPISSLYGESSEGLFDGLGVIHVHVIFFIRYSMKSSIPPDGTGSSLEKSPFSRAHVMEYSAMLSTI